MLSCSFIKNCKHPIVVKADGLAAGKGVYICETIEQSKKAIEEIFNGKFGEAKNLLIEEFLEGEEMSYFIISDGKTIKNFGTAQDHKRVLEGDKGKNTGGMGAYSPSGLINQNLKEKIVNKNKNYFDTICLEYVDGLREILEDDNINPEKATELKTTLTTVGEALSSFAGGELGASLKQVGSSILNFLSGKESPVQEMLALAEKDEELDEDSTSNVDIEDDLLEEEEDDSNPMEVIADVPKEEDES